MLVSFFFILWASIIFCGVSYEDKTENINKKSVSVVLLASFYCAIFLREKLSEKIIKKTKVEIIIKILLFFFLSCEIKENYKRNLGDDNQDDKERKHFMFGLVEKNLAMYFMNKKKILNNSNTYHVALNSVKSFI